MTWGDFLPNAAAIVGIAIPIIAFIVWLVRLESKAAVNQALLERLEVQIKSDAEQSEKQMTAMAEKFENHVMNQQIHFNHEIHRQVEKTNDLRFKTIEEELKSIDGKLDRLMDAK